jgi:hypothetical protein
MTRSVRKSLKKIRWPNLGQRTGPGTKSVVRIDAGFPVRIGC